MHQTLTKRQVKFDTKKLKFNKNRVKSKFTQMAETFGKWLEQVRISKGLNQTDLAKRARLSKTTISLYESDKVSQPRLKQLDKIARALEMSIDEIRSAFSSRNMVKNDTIPPEIKSIGFDGLDKDDLREIADFIKFRKAQKEKEK